MMRPFLLPSLLEIEPMVTDKIYTTLCSFLLILEEFVNSHLVKGVSEC